MDLTKFPARQLIEMFGRSVYGNMTWDKFAADKFKRVTHIDPYPAMSRVNLPKKYKFEQLGDKQHTPFQIQDDRHVADNGKGWLYATLLLDYYEHTNEHINRKNLILPKLKEYPQRLSPPLEEALDNPNPNTRVGSNIIYLTTGQGEPQFDQGVNKRQARNMEDPVDRYLDILVHEGIHCNTLSKLK